MECSVESESSDDNLDRFVNVTWKHNEPGQHAETLHGSNDFTEEQSSGSKMWNGKGGVFPLQPDPSKCFFLLCVLCILTALHCGHREECTKKEMGKQLLSL